MKVRIACRAVVDDWMIILLRTLQQTPNAFQWAGQPPNLPLSV